jgi:hypothetical protein
VIDFKKLLAKSKLDTSITEIKTTGGKRFHRERCTECGVEIVGRPMREHIDTGVCGARKEAKHMAQKTGAKPVSIDWLDLLEELQIEKITGMFVAKNEATSGLYIKPIYAWVLNTVRPKKVARWVLTQARTSSDFRDEFMAIRHIDKSEDGLRQWLIGVYEADTGDMIRKSEEVDDE